MTTIWELLEKLEIAGNWNFFLSLVNSGKLELKRNNSGNLELSENFKNLREIITNNWKN